MTILLENNDLRNNAMLDELIYASYAFNRALGLTPPDFRILDFPDVSALEARWQKEHSAKAATTEEEQS